MEHITNVSEKQHEKNVLKDALWLNGSSKESVQTLACLVEMEEHPET